ncbi:MarR family winged helix-turn-helix transcriptional regulator [Millisia brevis]|uniref:MarR family winged helix-turn-helix transcriptional regulator n=1 Tax=Millisia brevis TaxID=264148 RepID=UPI000836EE29|nr:MarR family winged helix-turn-helix transcriptional regulator [Millisia brevis]
MRTRREAQERATAADLRAVGEALTLALDQRLAPSGVSAFELAIIEALHAAESGRLRLTALADTTRSGLPRISRAVAGLERRGLVEKVACAADGRAINAVLTDSGIDVLRRTEECSSDTIRRVLFEALDEKEVAELGALLDKIVAGLE